MQLFQICFGVGLLFTIVSFLLGHVSDFGHFGDSSASGVDLGHIDTGHVDVGHVDVGHVDTGNVDAGSIHADLGHSGHVAVDGGGVWSSFLSTLKPLTIASFLTVFGGVGMILQWNGFNIIIAFVIAFFAGFILATALYKFIMIPLIKAQSTSSPDVWDLVGSEAKVIVRISENGVGEIYYTFRGNSFNSPAKSIDKRIYEKGEFVRIEKIESGIYYIKSALHLDIN